MISQSVVRSVANSGHQLVKLPFVDGSSVAQRPREKDAQVFLFSKTIIKNLDVFRDIYNGFLSSSVVTMKSQLTL